MRTYQRERRYICGRNRRAAQYQEVEIYPLPTRDGQGRDLDRENTKPPSFPRPRPTITPRQPDSGSTDWR